MTTTAYDTHFIASDIAFTDNNDVVSLDIPFRKVKRIGDIVLGMAGCLDCMVDFSNMIVDFVLQNSSNFDMPLSIMQRRGSDFVVIVYVNGACLKLSKLKDWDDIQIDNITQVPTVIGSGSVYAQPVIKDCPNAVVAVLEAIKHDKYTDGDVKYCSIRREDVHNLEIHPMSIQLQTQVTGLQKELADASEFSENQRKQGRTFKASTEVYYDGSPARISSETGMQLMRQGFSAIRDKLIASNS